MAQAINFGKRNSLSHGGESPVSLGVTGGASDSTLHRSSPREDLSVQGGAAAPRPSGREDKGSVNGVLGTTGYAGPAELHIGNKAPTIVQPTVVKG